jgi:hypothetical protein
MSADAWTAVAALAQVATVGVAGWALIYARGQVREARETRERAAQPNVVAFTDHNPKNWQYLDFVVKNFGETPAYNIKLTMAPPDVSPYHNNITGEDVGVTKLYVPEHIAVLAPGQEWRTIWDSAIKRKEHADKLSDNDVTGHLTFWDKMNHDPDAKPPFCNTIWIDPKMFRNMLRLTSVEPAKQITDEIAKVAATLESYHEDKSGIWVYTLPGETERQRREEVQAELRAEYDRIERAVERGQQRGTKQSTTDT